MINIKLIFNFFNLNKPRFTSLEYADFIINDKAYFLVTWQFKNAYRLKIRSLNYVTYKTGGSAYILVPNQTDSIDLAISNLWKSENYHIKFIRTSITTQLDFFPQKRFDELSKEMIYDPQLDLIIKAPFIKKQLSKVNISPFTVNIKNLNKH